ncbi:hypothetical protein ACTL6P_01905 [Endozoicomonas acroporae]|uniref:hypothetical protein n=1 Tax=Endozoicomonas acroporae TaxID=1701104 RepID=UPI000C793BC8|nr:hypothetical protein [Endozoicomonas acroporae]
MHVNNNGKKVDEQALVNKLETLQVNTPQQDRLPAPKDVTVIILTGAHRKSCSGIPGQPVIVS